MQDILCEVQTVASETEISKSISYEYNLGGSLKTLHYPSGQLAPTLPIPQGGLSQPVTEMARSMSAAPPTMPVAQNISATCQASIFEMI